MPFLKTTDTSAPDFEKDVPSARSSEEIAIEGFSLGVETKEAGDTSSKIEASSG